MMAAFNRLCVKAWLAAGTLKRQALGLLLWLLSDSYKLSDIKDFQS